MKTILIIEDESHDRNDIARILGNEGYKIHRSFGATDGIMIAERYLPDLILLDLFDKQKTLDTISRISSEPELLDIPLVAYTSIEDPNYLQELFVNGSDGFLRKPFSKKNLLTIVAMRLKKHAGTQARIEAREKDPFQENDSGKGGNDHVLVNIGAQLKLIKFSDIVCISAQKEYSMLCTDNRFMHEQIFPSIVWSDETEAFA